MSKPPPEEDRLTAAAFFVARASMALDAADEARSEAAAAALCKEAESWLYMASQCLRPGVANRPETLRPQARRAAAERRSFGDED